MTGEESRTGGEYLTTEKAIKNLPHFEKFCKVKIERIRRVTRLQEKLKILELGCSIGGTVVAWRNLGFECIGLEPSSIAVQNSLLFSEKIGIAVPVKQGVAEEIPFENDTFDFVNANSVIEHVQNVELAIKEIYRVLKPDGVFWFNAASSMCPLQDEIRGFPLFGWYPQVIKLRILNWVKVHRPELIGYTSYPAINWFTPGKTRKLLYSHGFRKVWDRWDLRSENEGGKIYNKALSCIRVNSITKLAADICIPGCSYAALK